MKRYLLPLALLAYAFTLAAQTGIWQWSIPVRNFSKSPKHKECKAYLWIPDTCRQVKSDRGGSAQYGGDFHIGGQGL